MVDFNNFINILNSDRTFINESIIISGSQKKSGYTDSHDNRIQNDNFIPISSLGLYFF